MNFFEKEMRQMFDDNDFFQDAKFVGKTMLAKLDEDLRIKLQFIASHISGQYDTVQMTIINRTDGMVDKQNFKFSDIIGKCIRPGREPLDYHMWEYNNKPEQQYHPAADDGRPLHHHVCCGLHRVFLQGICPPAEFYRYPQK